MGCRAVRPKEYLLRFVKAFPAGVSYDNDASVQSRGFYLCPDENCFNEAYKNKRARTVFFRKHEDVKQVIREVREKILNFIEKDLIFCDKAGYLYDARAEEMSIREDSPNILLIHDNPPEEKVQVQAPAGFLSSRVFFLPDTPFGRFHEVIVDTRYPKMKRLISNLQKFERLSSKGQAL